MNEELAGLSDRRLELGPEIRIVQGVQPPINPSCFLADHGSGIPDVEGSDGLVGGVADEDGEELGLRVPVVADDVPVRAHHLQLALRLVRELQPPNPSLLSTRSVVWLLGTGIG